MRAIAAGCLALGLLAAACGGDTERPGSASSPGAAASATTTATAGPSAPADAASAPPAGSTSTAAARTTAPPVPSPPAATNDRVGRDAFARHVLQAWIYALNTNDPQPLLDLSGAEPCDGCAELATELERRADEGWYVALDGVRVSGVELVAEGGAARAVMSVSIPESATFHEDGSFRSSNPGHPRSTFEVAMAHDGTRYRLTSFSLY